MAVKPMADWDPHLWMHVILGHIYYFIIKNLYSSQNSVIILITITSA